MYSSLGLYCIPYVVLYSNVFIQHLAGCTSGSLAPATTATNYNN